MMEPNAPNAVAEALAWVAALLAGSLATIIAIILVAGLGLGLLGGRVDVRRAITVVLGMCIVFGSARIAAGLMSGVDQKRAEQAPAIVLMRPPVTPSAAAVRAAPSDPYAGASYVPPTN